MDEEVMLHRLVDSIEQAAANLKRIADVAEKMLSMDEDARRQYQQVLATHNQ